VHDLDAVLARYRRLGLRRSWPNHSGTVSSGGGCSCTSSRMTRTTPVGRGRGLGLRFRRQRSSRPVGLSRCRRPVLGSARHPVWPSGVRVNRPRRHRASSRLAALTSGRDPRAPARRCRIPPSGTMPIVKPSRRSSRQASTSSPPPALPRRPPQRPRRQLRPIRCALAC
jgi:hypothetical protein